MKLRTLVIEDEWATRNHLAQMLQASGAADVVGAVASAESARQVLDTALADGGSIDLALVDVQLVGSPRDDEGLDLVRDYAGRSGAPAFVLATAFREHAIEAFDLGVVDYLLKPFSEERVDRCLARVGSKRVPSPAATTSPTRLVARRKRALVFIRLDDVWAFESAERLAYVHTARGRFEIDLSLTAIEASIGRALMRAHRSWLVNADHVLELEGYGSETELLVGSGAGEREAIRIPVSRDRAQAVRDALLAHTTGLRPR
ncbi:MAG TPA: LytTR family DNA-binding domain-containing protein [Polyangiaceae bacterium]